MDITPLRDAYLALIEAATTVAAATDPITPPVGEWNADQVLAHVSIINAAAIVAAADIAAVAPASYDSRASQDTWTINRIVERAGGNAALQERVRCQGNALCALISALSEAELDTLVPTLLVSKGEALVDQPISLRDIVTGLAEAELPGHTQQLLALLPAPAETAV